MKVGRVVDEGVVKNEHAEKGDASMVFRRGGPAWPPGWWRHCVWRPPMRSRGRHTWVVPDGGGHTGSPLRNTIGVGTESEDSDLLMVCLVA